VIVCFGDSLTAGHGAAVPGVDDPQRAYPAYLEKRLGRPVINAGVSGDTTFDALERLERDVLAYNPSIVIIEFGANDFFKQVPPRETQENFAKMLALLTGGGTHRTLYAAKFYTEKVAYDMARSAGRAAYTDPREFIACYDAVFDSLTPAADLIPDIWTGVWGRYMSDDLHPNAKGYEIMADHYFRRLRSLRLF
jgi:lysophospholipase L1-like esterase